MKKRYLAAVMAFAVSFSGIFLVGCGKDVPTDPIVYEDNSLTDETGNADDIADVTNDDTDTVIADADVEYGLEEYWYFPDAAYLIEINWQRSDGEEHLEDIFYVDGEQYTDEDAVYAGDELVYERTVLRYGEGDEQGTTMLYGIYSLDHDMYLMIEPNAPENTIDINSITLSVTAQNGSEEVSLGKDFSELGGRGGTGIWYAGIFTVKDGKLGPFEW